MKRLKYSITILLLSFILNSSFAQTINWKNLEPTQKNIINLNAGFDNASVAGIGYGYQLISKIPLVLNLEYSMPLGNKLFDDFKTKLGGQLNLVRANSFYGTIKAHGIFRRFENPLVTMLNFGSEFSATAGIYKKKWFAAGEVGFDKAIVTQISHSELMKENNPGLESGWYIPTGGNFLYGIQAGYSIKKNDIYVKIGKTIEQDFKTSPSVPYYFQVGWSTRW